MAKHSSRSPQVFTDSSTDMLITKFTNHVMLDGKKSIAQKMIKETFSIIKQRTEKEGEEVFVQALNNVYPRLEVRPMRIGGANYQIPREVDSKRRVYLAMNWMITAARGKKGRSMAERLADEIINASSEQGDAIRKKEEMHKMAEANRAFAHFARFRRKK